MAYTRTQLRCGCGVIGEVLKTRSTPNVSLNERRYTYRQLRFDGDNDNTHWLLSWYDKDANEVKFVCLETKLGTHSRCKSEPMWL